MVLFINSSRTVVFPILILVWIRVRVRVSISCISAIAKEKPEKKKIQASAGLEPVTSAIPVQCSTN